MKKTLPNSPSDFEVVYTETVFETRYLRVRHDKIKKSNTISDFYTAVREDASFVVPFDGTYIYLIMQFRYQTMTWFYEIPAGRVNPNEEMLTAAHRELTEETGLVAKKMEQLCKFAISPGMSDAWGHCFLATDLVDTTHTNHDDSERIARVHRCTLNEVREMMADGTITNGPTLAGLGIFFARHNP